MTKKELATQVVDQMMKNDFYSQWLGIERIDNDAGKSVLQMKVRREMLNGFGTAHGAITFALADSALAFACNSHGRQAVSIETSISHTKAVKEGEILRAYAEEESLSHKIGFYKVIIKREDGEIVALFKGTVYRTSKEWSV
ncbi:MAG: acyl-CoA thioesterase [Paraglaciecola sp.]|jgi:acyl-CoA thioesterase